MKTQFDVLKENFYEIRKRCYDIDDLFDFIDRCDTSREARRIDAVEEKTGDTEKMVRYLVEGHFSWWNGRRSVQGTWYGWEDAYYYLDDGEWMDDISYITMDKSKVAVDDIVYYLNEEAKSEDDE